MLPFSLSWRRSAAALLLSLSLAGLGTAAAQDDPNVGSRNLPARLDWFRDQGFGIFIHWSVDSQLGVVISHSLVGASPEYTERFYHDLPQTFDPTRFDPDEWARLARIAGARYVVFTTKHHSGFTMFHTATTPFGIENTPFKRDVTKELFTAFRAQGLHVGVYYSPDDFYWLHQHGIPINRLVPQVQPGANPGLLAYDKEQLTELLTNYGPIDMLYLDGEAKDLRDLAWKLHPNIVVTRGAMVTPELFVPSSGPAGAWETAITMGAAWQYQPDNDTYKSGQDLIRLLCQTRARGGNLLLNIGPTADGNIAPEQENRLREIGLWMFVNSDAIYGVRPWIIPNEGNIWFTRKKDDSALFAILDSQDIWPRGTWREFVLHSVRATAHTTISVLGQDDKTVEYRPGLVPKSTFHQEADGLHIRVMRAQRLQDNSRWPNAPVVRLTDVQPALVPPQVRTASFRADPSGIALTGDVTDMGDAKTLEAGFELRPVSGEDVNARSAPWQATPLTRVGSTGAFTRTIAPLPPGAYEYHALVKHPLLTLYGDTKRLVVP